MLLQNQAQQHLMNAPLGDETKTNQHLATNVILIGCETEELEEARENYIYFRL